MAPRKPSPAQIRDRRARIAVIVLGCVLLIVGAIQGPKVLKLLKGPSAAAPPVASPTPGASTTGTPSTPGAPGTSPVAFTPGAPLSTSAVGNGQLDGFSLLAPKDPFQSQTPAADASGTLAATPVATKPRPPAATTTTATTATATTTTATTPATTQPVATAPVVGATVTTPLAPSGVRVGLVSMNGLRQVVPVDGKFPLAKPMFQIVALGARHVRLGLVTGSFADGSRTLTLWRSHKLTLLDRSDGTRYVIQFVRMTRAQIAPAGTMSPAATTAEPPAATTPTTTSSTG